MIAHQLVSKVKNLPVISQAALKLVGLLDQPVVSNDDIVTVLKYDNVLTAKLLRSCNSPYFGFKDPVSSVEQAVLLLGHHQILHIVLSLAFGGVMSVPLPGYAAEAKQLWHHSLTTALAAEQIAKGDLTVDFDPTIAFTAGLLHDMGKLVFNHTLTDEVQKDIRRRITDGHLSLSEAEQEVIGTDHGEVGGCLMETWRLPPDIVEAVACHHRPHTGPRPKLSALTHVANSLAHLVGSTFGWEAYALRCDPRANEALGITPLKLEQLVISVHDATGKVEQFMTMI